MNRDEKTVHKIGPNGFKCVCCEPTPKDRPKYRRVIKARLKAQARKNHQKSHEE